LLDSAREHLDDTFAVLIDAVTGRIPIILLEPSCFAVFKDEARALTGDRRFARALAEQAVLFETFLQPHFERGELPRLHGRVVAHVHCHQQALMGRESTEAALGSSGLDACVLDAGCCGMAGSFGYDAQHYDVSVAVGERTLLPAVRQAPTGSIIIANGFSCREQIHQLTGRQARHFAEVVCDAVREMRAGRIPTEGAA
jgi:Fe-S oxidoreductase